MNSEIIKKPDYIKIDVDGIEHLILEGASLLKNLSNIEILIEINDNFIEQKKSAGQLEEYNFSLKKYENISGSIKFKILLIIYL